MNTKTKKTRIMRAFLLTAAIVLLCLGWCAPFKTIAKADTPTDEIEHFQITVDVREDASLEMTYHIDWKVLDDEKYGPLTWADIGVPNNHHSAVTALVGVDHIEDKGNTLAVYLDRDYYKDETASFEFSFVQDNMYQIDRYTDGETVYTFTPAWFDEIEVKDLTIRWNGDKAQAWQPDCLQDNGYLVFSTALAPGKHYKMSVTYLNDAFGFSKEHQAGGSSSKTIPDENDILYTAVGAFIVLFVFIFLPVFLIVKFVRWITGGTGFGGSGSEGKKIVRTKIEYYENCPSCGAVREEGKDDCPYCGHSMIKSKEVVEEKDLEKPEAYRKAGTYRYGTVPNTYIHVNVIPAPASRSRHSGGSHRSGSGHHSSCASSCACACASSCACACACASSGRAGCSVKEFFEESIHSGRVRVESKR